MTASDILREAADIVDGARGQTHGDRHQTFEMTAALWSAYLGHPISKADVAWMMALLKASRAKCGEPARDHFVDAGGYCGLAGELSGV